MTTVEVISYILVPIMLSIGFPSIVILIGFNFAMSRRITTLEADMAHMEKGIVGVQDQLDKMSGKIDRLLAFANQEKGRRQGEDSDSDESRVFIQPR